MLEFGCELLSDAPEAAAAAAEHAPESHLLPVLVLPEEAQDAEAPRAATRRAGRRFRARAGREPATERRRPGFAVLTKLVEQGPGFDLYEFVAVR